LRELGCMSDANGILRNALVESYDHLLEQLERRLRSSELAREALHDTYLRLERGNEIRLIEKPVGYLLSIAINIARDRQRRARFFATGAEVENALHLADETPDPAREAEAKSEVAALLRAISKLPPRRQAILLACYRDNQTPAEIARRFDLSKRSINAELKLAREYCIRILSGRAKNNASQ
jgi:RNA polymerase sigma factor (sigma-70 family)